MTTDNELQEQVPEPRPVEELIKLDSYEGMTDQEIESVIDLKCAWAYNEGARQNAYAENEKRNAIYMDALAEVHAQAASLFDAVKNITPDLQVIDYGQTE